MGQSCLTRVVETETVDTAGTSNLVIQKWKKRKIKSLKFGKDDYQFAYEHWKEVKEEGTVIYQSEGGYFTHKGLHRENIEEGMKIVKETGNKVNITGRAGKVRQLVKWGK